MKERAIVNAITLALLAAALPALSGCCLSPARTEVPRQPGADAAPGPGASVSITAEGYVPRTLSVPSGTTVRWTNHDRTRHNVGGSGLVSGVLEPGEGYSHRFDQPGTYQYTCTFHPDTEEALVEVVPR